MEAVAKREAKRKQTKRAVRAPIDEPQEEPKSPYKSAILGAVHSLAAAIHEVGGISDERMKEYDDAALTPVQEFGPEEIKALRESVDITQAVLARVLNVSLSAVRQWEQGEKRPSGSALKLLSLARAKGMASIM